MVRMDMKKFLVKGFLFVVIGAILLSAVNYLYVNTNGYRSSISPIFKFDNLPEGINVVNLGSSHGYADFFYEDIDCIRGFNLGLQYQSFYYDLQVLEKYRDNLAEGCTVIIPISYISFGHECDDEVQKLLYYQIMEYGDVRYHNLSEYLKLKLFPVLSASFNIKYLIKDKGSIEDGDNSIESNLYTEDQIRDVARRGSDYHKAWIKRKNYEANILALGRLIEYCRENGLTPILTTTPFTRYYNDNFTSDFYREFYSMIDGITEEYEIPYLDYSHDPLFTDDIGLFKDDNHLNSKGRRIFTKMILADLNIYPGEGE